MEARVGPTFSKSQMVGLGVSERQWRKWLRDGLILRIARSRYTAVSPELREQLARVIVLDPTRRHVARALAAQQQIHAPTLIGEVSAAQIHLLSLPYPMDDRVTLLGEPTTVKPRSYPGIRVLARHVPVGHRTRVMGLELTTVARTVVDVARRRPMRDALIVGDSALRAGLDPAELEEVLGTQAGVPYVQNARYAVIHMDRVRESPLESESFAFFVERNLPLPECQIWNGTDRLDFLWRSRRVFGEADGRVKYVGALGVDQGDGEALRRQQGRQARVGDLGFRGVRWTHPDLRRRPDELERRLRRALGA